MLDPDLKILLDSDTTLDSDILGNTLCDHQPLRLFSHCDKKTLIYPLRHTYTHAPWTNPTSPTQIPV